MEAITGVGAHALFSEAKDNLASNIAPAFVGIQVSRPARSCIRRHQASSLADRARQPVFEIDSPGLA